MAINKTKAGTWRVDHYYKVDGKFKRAEKTFEKHKDALAFYESTRTKVRNKEYVPPSKRLMKEMAAKWLERKKTELKIQSYQQSELHVERYIKPAFGDMPMTDITFEMIEAAGRRWKEEREISPKTVNKVFTALSAIFTSSKKFGVRNNPMLDVDRQRENKSLEAIEAEALAGLVEVQDDEGKDGHLRAIGPHEVYTAEEVRKLIANSKEGLERALLLTAVMTGMRHGEPNALQWERQHGNESLKIVDFDKAHIFVSRSLTQLKGRSVIELPKTKNAYRHIPMPPKLVSELKQWKRWGWGPKGTPNPNDLVFVNEDGSPLDRRSNNRTLKAAAVRAKIKVVSMHNLRHTFASQLLDAGRPVPEVSKLLGHHDPGITMRVYAHFVGQDHTKTLGELEERYFSEARR